MSCNLYKITHQLKDIGHIIVRGNELQLRKPIPSLIEAFLA